MSKTLILLLTLGCFFSMKAIAWGPNGHRIVGEIAQKHLDGGAKRAIKKLIGRETLAMVSNWPDFIRSDATYNYTHPWHYVTIPDGKCYDDIEKEPKGDVIEAIGRMIKTLKNKEKSQEEKIQALKFLVHFVGDIHQPLHVGKPGDRGGNDVRVKWFNKEVNLHHLWDEELIALQQLSYTEFASNLDIANKQVVKQWMKDDINVWVKESMDLRPSVYAIGDGVLGYNYNFLNSEHLSRRLLQGGIRLAGVLNSIF